MNTWTATSDASENVCLRLTSACERAIRLLALLAAIGIHVLDAQCTPRAIVIGVSLYKDPSWTLLRHAKNDAIAFSDWFQKNTVCGSGGAPGGKPIIKLLTDNQATQTNILNALSSELLTAGPDDEIF